MQVRVKKGFDLPLQGEPEQSIGGMAACSRVAVLGRGFIGLKPRLKIKPGDHVRAAQPLFENRQNGIVHTAPASGTILAINRGPRRSLLSIEIEVDGTGPLDFPAFDAERLEALSAGEVKETLLASGLWTAFRARPFGLNPGAEETPHSIFVTASDSNPLAADPAVVIGEYMADFRHGLTILSRLFTGPLFLCKTPSLSLPGLSLPNLQAVDFLGPHPAGLVGTHIHYLDTVSREKTVWHLGYQDVIAMGKLFTEGRLWTERVVALAGPRVANPRLVKTRLGASLDQLLENELSPGNGRIISGSVLSGHLAVKEEAYLGRYHTQVSVLEESGMSQARKKRLGSGRRSLLRGFLIPAFTKKRGHADTAISGARRPMYPLEDFDDLMPLDLLTAPLLRALLIEDDEEALALGCLELDEEDLALCTFACVSNNEYGKALRNTLDRIAGISQ